MVPLDSSGLMVRYVLIEQTVILIMCIRKSYEKNSQNKRQIGRCNCILSQKKYKIATCASANAIGGTIPDNLTDSDSDGIGGGTGCNSIFFTVPTTCSRPSIEMVGFMYLCIYLFLRVHSPGHTVIFLAQIWHVAPLAPSNDHLRIRFLI